MYSSNNTVLVGSISLEKLNRSEYLEEDEPSLALLSDRILQA